jgi:hypothetical protein
MYSEFSFEQSCLAIAVMEKQEVIGQLLGFQGPLKLDFTQDYLEGLTVDRLRHILLAAVVTASRKCIS